MKIEELRIGSILTYNGVNVKVEVINNEIGEVYVWGDDFYYNVELENLKPIPLTEEWLLKFGFVKTNNDKFFYDRFRLSWNDKYKFWYVFDKEISTYLSKVEYIHEIQNLYFVLNGQELCEAK